MKNAISLEIYNDTIFVNSESSTNPWDNLLMTFSTDKCNGVNGFASKIWNCWWLNDNRRERNWIESNIKEVPEFATKNLTKFSDTICVYDFNQNSAE